MLMKFPGGVLKALTLSYDDGVCYDRKLIEIMRKHGLKGTFNVNSGSFAEKSGERRMTAEETKQLYEENGMEVALHGLYHRHLEDLHAPVMCYEVMKDRENLEALFGKVVRGMAYAFGTYSNDAVETLKRAGIVYSRTTISNEKFDIPKDWLRLEATCHHNNPRLFELAEAFLSPEPKEEWRQRPRLFYLWGHSYEFNDNNNWNIIEKFAEITGDREDVWYATNIEVYDYVEAYKNLVLSCDGKIVYNPSALDVWFCDNGRDYCLKPGETVKL